jgi:hypothetical protein
MMNYLPRIVSTYILRIGAVACVGLLLVSCGGPRLMTKQEALRDNRVMRLKIVKVLSNDRFEQTTEFNISHVIEADVLEGPEELIGKPIKLPFDKFFVAEPPPQKGDVVLITPADWVKRRDDGRQRPFGR